MADGNAERSQLRGGDAIAEAIEAGRPVQLVFVREGPLSQSARALLHLCKTAGIPVRSAGEREMKRLSADPLPQALLALVGDDPAAGLDALLSARGTLWLLAGVAYPGNAGFAIRTAEVSGAAGIIVDASFDHAGRRQALRAAMRADRIFPVLFARSHDVVRSARAAGHRIIGIEDRGRFEPWQVDLTGPVVFVIGGEARGVERSLLDACDCVVRIPMPGFIPSYNLQAATAIVAGERLRQLAQGRIEGD
jgi:tRNA G18 (ribose-2'-O)-methylase SpoU